MKKVVTDQQKTTVKKVLDYIRRYWFYLGLSIVLAAVTVALTLYIPILTGRAVDLIITKGQVDFAGILRAYGSGDFAHGSRAVDHECMQQ